MRKSFLIYEEMHKYLVIHEVALNHTVYDFAPDPFGISLYLRKIFLSFLTVYRPFLNVTPKRRLFSINPSTSDTLCWTVKYTEESSSTLVHTQQSFQAADLGCISYSTKLFYSFSRERY
jgi:hypothetical protein